MIGTTLQTDKYPFPVLTDMIIYNPEPITTPVGQKTADWLKTLTLDMMKQFPQPVAFKA